ncbi:MAG: hypothetical protein JRH20_27780 [Deltaproteobacteria bacterium]|nr:hypothetical protein [Deltaproteobacteria bacterium]
MRTPAPFLASGKAYYMVRGYNAPMSVGDRIVYVGNDGEAIWLFGLDPKTSKIEQLARINDVLSPSTPNPRYPTITLHRAQGDVVVSVDKKPRWRTDGSLGGTHALAEQSSWNKAVSADGYSHFAIVVAGRALFHFSTTLVRYDIDAESTRSYPTVAGPRYTCTWLLSGDNLFVTADGDQVVRIDAKGTVHPLGLNTEDFTVAKLGPSAFLIRDLREGSLWLSDGISASATRIQSGFSARSHRLMFAHGGRAFFVGGTTSSDIGVWVSDGTGAGTVQSQTFLWRRDWSISAVRAFGGARMAPPLAPMRCP